MYVQCYIVAHLRKYCYFGNATICSRFIFVGVDVAVNNKKCEEREKTNKMQQLDVYY